MKNLFLILSFFLFFSCEKKEYKIIEKGEINKIKEPKVSLTKNEITIESFKEFRQALYQNDLKKVKEFINFPIVYTNGSTQFWALANGDFLGEEKDFTEKDFDKYHSKIFTKGFINAILKIKSDKIFTENGFETGKVGDKKFYSKITVISENNRKGNFLYLDLIENKEFDSESNPDEKVMEEIFTRYIFEILESGKLKFLNLELAG